MMDLHEATKTLDAYSTLLASKTRLCDKVLSSGIAEEANVIEKLIAVLKAETKETTIILTLVLEDIVKHHEQFAVGFTEQLTKLIEAINRNRAATDEARKITGIHEAKSRIKEPEESSSAKAIREFLARRHTAVN